MKAFIFIQPFNQFGDEIFSGILTVDSLQGVRDRIVETIITPDGWLALSSDRDVAEGRGGQTIIPSTVLRQCTINISEALPEDES